MVNYPVYILSKKLMLLKDKLKQLNKEMFEDVNNQAKTLTSKLSLIRGLIKDI